MECLDDHNECHNQVIMYDKNPHGLRATLGRSGYTTQLSILSITGT